MGLIAGTEGRMRQKGSVYNKAIGLKGESSKNMTGIGKV